jgi:hypothetical protein
MPKRIDPSTFEPFTGPPNSETWSKPRLLHLANVVTAKGYKGSMNRSQLCKAIIEHLTENRELLESQERFSPLYGPEAASIQEVNAGVAAATGYEFEYRKLMFSSVLIDC